MGNRIKYILLPLCLIWLCVPVFAQESLPVSAVGIRDFSRYFTRDFSIKLDYDDIFIVDEDYLGYVVFEAFRNEHGIADLKAIIDGIRDERLREGMTLKLLFAARERDLLEDFRRLYEVDLLAKNKERILLALCIEGNTPFRYSFTDRSVTAFRDAHVMLTAGRPAAAVNLLRPFAGTFPHTFYYMLMESGSYKEAYEFIAGQNVDGVDGMKIKAMYMMGDCGAVLDALKGGGNSYDERLVSIDCKIRQGTAGALEAEFRQQTVSVFINDDFWILKKFATTGLEEEPFFENRYRAFYYRWKLVNYARYLFLYGEEMRQFQEKLNGMEKDFAGLSDKFQKIWSLVEREEAGRNLRDRYLSIGAMLEKVKKLNMPSVSNGKSMHDYFSKALAGSRDALKKAYDEYAAQKAREAVRLRKEAEFRFVAKKLEEPEKFDAAELRGIYNTVKVLYAEAVTNKLTFEEAAAFARVYALWEHYLKLGLTDLAQNDKALDEVMAEIGFYLKRYDRRKRQILLLRAEAYDRRGDYGRAYDGYLEYFAAGGDVDGRTYFKVAEILFDRKDYQQAIEYYQKAQERSPDYKNVACYKIGWCYYKMSRLDEVADLFLGYDFGNFEDKREVVLGEMLDLLAKVFFKIGDESLIDGFMSRYTGFPYPDRLFKQLGDLHLFLADYEKAEKAYERGFSRYYLYESSHELMTALMEISSMTGREQEAYRQRVRYIESYGIGSGYHRKFGVVPKNYRDVLLSAALYFDAAYGKEKDAGSYDNAVKFYELFLDMYSDDRQAGEAAFLLGQMKEDRNEFARAAELYTIALKKGFREEDSQYKYVYCRYRLWQGKKQDTPDLLAAMEAFASRYPGSDKSLSIYLTVAEIQLSGGNEPAMFGGLDRAVEFPGGKGVEKAMEFAEANGDAVSDKRKLAALFERGWKISGNRRYIELKQYTLFTLARKAEERNETELAATLYEQMMNDSERTVFADLSTFNYALILQKRGDTRKSLELMSRIQGGDKLGLEAKNFVLAFGKKEKLYWTAAIAAEELAVIDPGKAVAHLLDAGWLYLKAGEAAPAGRVIAAVSRTGLTDDEQTDFDMVQAALLYARGDYDGVLKVFQAAQGRPVRGEWQEELTAWYADSVARLVPKKKIDDAREIISRLVDYLGERVRATGDNAFVYLVGSVLCDYSSYFIQKEEVLAKAREFLRKALANASRAGDSAMVLKAVGKLKEAGSESRRLSYPGTELKTPLLKSDGVIDKGGILERRGRDGR